MGADGFRDMKEIEVDATVDNLDLVNGFVEELLTSLDCSMKLEMQLSLVVEEIFVNIASYAYEGKTGKAVVQGGVEKDSATVKLVFIDEGMPYNPLEKEDPDISLSAEERGIGGLGIFLVKKNVDDISYEHKDGKNILTLWKKMA